MPFEFSEKVEKSVLKEGESDAIRPSVKPIETWDDLAKESPKGKIETYDDLAEKRAKERGEGIKSLDDLANMRVRGIENSSETTIKAGEERFSQIAESMPLENKDEFEQIKGETREKLDENNEEIRGLSSGAKRKILHPEIALGERAEETRVVPEKKFTGISAEEIEKEERLEKIKAFETWQKLVVGEKKGDVEVGELENEQFKELLYKKVEDKLEETIRVLDIKLDERLIERMNKEKDSNKKAETQKKIVKSVVEQLYSIPHNKWAFTPQEIEKKKEMNCSGAALLCGHILNKLGIKAEYGYPAGHAMNFVELADGTVEYIDARTNVIEDVETKEEKVNGLRIRKLNHEGIDYKLIPSVSQKDAIGAILSNIEALKSEAKKEGGDPAAKEIYEQNKNLLETVNYQELFDELYPEAQFFKTKEWKDEENRIKGPEAFNKYLNKIRERFLDLSSDIQERLKPELKNQKELIHDFLLNKKIDIESKASKELLDFINQIKQELSPLQKRNIEDYNNFVEYLIGRF